MTFLQTIITRKSLKIKDLSPGNGGCPPENESTQGMRQGIPALFALKEKETHPCGCASSVEAEC
jgi:hypothetical protein